MTAAALSTLCIALAACGSAPGKKVKFSEEKYGVAASPRMVKDGKPVPKGGGRYMVGKPYKVAGKWYKPKEDPNYTSVGYASWYGPTFHGRKTANGEIFDRNALTAAHTTMPLPSYARVTNVKNGRSMIVRVNDRGPFHGNRTIDLSERVATMLDFKGKGVAKVKVEYVGRARLDGKDQDFLMASYSGPGAVSPGATMPGTQLAQATPPAPVSAGPAPVPRTRPYQALLASSQDFGRTVTAAFDPADAFDAGPAAVQVASLNGGFSAPVEQTADEVPALGYKSEPAVRYQPTGRLAPVGNPAGAFRPGSAVSSYMAASRIAGAYAAFENIGGGRPLGDMAKTR
ncbi:septal ring lytic transglycosylase RlpA family protein [Stappia sp.]|jgi:rare lipoprotein A|uniref:septal ring lytic transglycosylase RlpA family protein n=1 Tax=Stappia sp. TaxID=1870903 RepID=UPI003A98FD82